MRWFPGSTWIAALPILAASTTAAQATTIVLVNDGASHAFPTEGPPTPAAVDFVVRDAGCGTPADPWIDPCLTGGASTHATFGAFADKAGNLYVRDSSSIVVDGIDLSGAPNVGFIGRISAGGASHVELLGGRLDGLILFSSATATIRGGESEDGRPLFVSLSNASQADIQAPVGPITLRNGSSATLRSEATRAWVETGGELRIEGGSLGELVGRLGTITLVSGSIQSLSLDGFAQMTVLGGVPQASALQPLDLKASSRLTLMGIAFRLDGLPIGPGAIAATSGRLEITDASGLTWEADFVREPTARLVLIPEPATGLLVAMGLATLARRGRARLGLPCRRPIPSSVCAGRARTTCARWTSMGRALARLPHRLRCTSC